MNPKTPRSQWLDAQEQEVWREYLRGSRLLEAALDHDLQAHGLQLSEYEILSMLSEQPDRRLRMSVIAELVVQSRSRLTHTAGRLEDRGWVRREACAGDRRGVELVLTDAGFAEITQMAQRGGRDLDRLNLVGEACRSDGASQRVHDGRAVQGLADQDRKRVVERRV